MTISGNNRAAGADAAVDQPGCGTSLQVQVPTLATTGTVQLVNVATRDLGFSTSYPDAIYRGMTVQFTATGATSAINFADGGLEGINNESWGIDNVSVAHGATTIFSDNFESGAANAAWTQNVVDTSTPGAFTSFLGRFSNGGDTLNLSGLTAGQSYTLHFDLYAIDLLDGLGVTVDGSGNIVPAQFGPDELNVTVDGSRKLSLAMSDVLGGVQNFNGSATLPLQIVPTLASMDGSPSGEGTFNLFGSGFQAGAMTVTVGGVTLPDQQFTNQHPEPYPGRAITAGPHRRTAGARRAGDGDHRRRLGDAAGLRVPRPSRRCSSPGSPRTRPPARRRTAPWRRPTPGRPSR